VLCATNVRGCGTTLTLALQAQQYWFNSTGAKELAYWYKSTDTDTCGSQVLVVSMGVTSEKQRIYVKNSYKNTNADTCGAQVLVISMGVAQTARLQVLSLLALLSYREHRGTQFTCFTSTKVQILTQKLVQKYKC
jgi:hypothetical protein